MKKLVLAYELSWRTKDDKKFLQSSKWKKEIRPRILDRDNNTCQYCGHRSDKQMQVNHIDGNPKNNSDDNLETICDWCHKIMHSGLWCVVFKIIDLYAESKYNQNEIIMITRKMREEGKSDEEIVEFLGLKKPVPWKQDLNYLSKLFGFISARNPFPARHVTITEEEQRNAVENRDNW
ncbi:MAG: hypothetical protein ACRD38_04955 [Nitrososphaerales archaeon]